MTKGVLVCLSKDKITGKTVILSSPQYNGDMGYTQSNGGLALKKLFGIKGTKNFSKIVLEFAEKYDYLDLEDMRENNGDLDGVLTEHGESINDPYIIDKNVLLHELKYSDFAYIVNCLDKPFYYVDMNNDKHLLVPNAEEVAVFHYGYYIGSMINRDNEKIRKQFILMKDKKDWPDEIRSD